MATDHRRLRVIALQAMNAKVSTGSYFFQHVNVVALPKRERQMIQLQEGSNCPLMAADMTEAGRVMWKGMEGICNFNATEVVAGAKSLTPKKITAAIKNYIPSNFAVNYRRFYRDGWLSRGFVTYFSGPLEGSESKAVEVLIDSVHRFSVYPIVVLHGGMATPLHWTPEIYPRLILLSMTELPQMVGFGASRLVAAVISHVQTGILLGHGALVFPGIDRFFSATEREITASYPYPILPVHSREKKTRNESYWTHLCHVDGLLLRECKQSMHWGQLGCLFWSLDALPFLSNLLRALLRDETFAAEAPYAPLRVRRTLDIESLLNVALWRVGAHKQWCKLDVDWPEVLQWLDLPEHSSQCVNSSICTPLFGGRFLPRGIPRVFVSMGSTSNFRRTREILERVENRTRRGVLPDPIVFRQIYHTGKEAKDRWPDIPCLLG
eukprot:Skav218027  [mRNA]  locus=scaffold214:103282:115607:- [translate_table: standard]